MMPASIEKKLNAYVHAVDSEIAGMGSVEVRDDGNIWVTDIAIYDQEVTGGTADLSSEALAGFQTELIQRGESPKNWVLWWHSHVNMSAYFSGTDTGTIETSTEFDHIISLVVNKKRERRCRIDTHKVNGLPMRITKENITVQVVKEPDERIEELDRRIEELETQRLELEYGPLENIGELIAEVEAKVHVKKFHMPAGYHQPQRQLPAPVTKANRKSDLAGDLDPTWSKKRKKDGTVSTAGEIIHTMGLDEILLMIEETHNMIVQHEYHGNGETPEVEELKEDLIYWRGRLDQYYYETEDIEDDDDPRVYYLNGVRYVSTLADEDDELFPRPYGST